MILDSTALVAFAMGDPAIEPHLREADEIVIPLVSMALVRGAVFRKSPNGELYEDWWDQLQEDCRTLQMDRETAEKYQELLANLKQLGTPIPRSDVWIAALALQHGLPVLSRDRHLDFVPGLRRISW